MKKRSRASGFILGDQVKSLVIWMDLKLEPKKSSLNWFRYLTGMLGGHQIGDSQGMWRI